MLPEILYPLIISLIGGLIVYYLTKGTKKSLATAVILFVTALFGPSIIIPPYNVANVDWCITSNNSLEVTGDLTSLLGSSIANYPVQIKIYIAGEGEPPFKSARWKSTDSHGKFVVEYGTPMPNPDTNYLVNAVYRYDSILGEKWKITDFYMGSPLRCPS